MGPGFATVVIDDHHERVWDATDTLACEHTHVSVLVCDDGARMHLSETREQLCVPVRGRGASRIGRPTFSVGSIGFVPAGIARELTVDGTQSLFVIEAGAAPDTDGDIAVLDVAACEFVHPGTSDILTARLTDSLGCTGMKVNARRLEPGQFVPYHTEGTQEELFIPIAGPASMRIAGETRDTPVGTVTRVAPEVPRSVVNDGTERALWVMIGAPPTGPSTGWDPGATILEESTPQSAGDSISR